MLKLPSMTTVYRLPRLWLWLTECDRLTGLATSSVPLRDVTTPVSSGTDLCLSLRNLLAVEADSDLDLDSRDLLSESCRNRDLEGELVPPSLEVFFGEAAEEDG